MKMAYKVNKGKVNLIKELNGTKNLHRFRIFLRQRKKKLLTHWDQSYLNSL